MLLNRDAITTDAVIGRRAEAACHLGALFLEKLVRIAAPLKVCTRVHTFSRWPSLGVNTRARLFMTSLMAVGHVRNRAPVCE